VNIIQLFLNFKKTWKQKQEVNKRSYYDMTDTGLTKEDTVKIQVIFDSHKNIKKVILYGSCAMSTFKPASDIDLTLVGKHINLTQLNEIEDQLDDLYLPYKTDLSIFDQIESSDFFDHIKRVGQEFYKSN
jgi:predicted nucleotidyltransferase